MNATDEPAAAMPRRAVLPPKGLLLCCLAQLPLVAAFWPPAPTPTMIAAGVVLLVAGAILNVWSDALFRRDGVGVCPFSPVRRLIRDGPYRVSRNPMYVGLVSLAAGATLVTGVPANLWAPAAFAAWLHYRYVLPEEAFLRARVGAAYDDYARAVPRWLGIPGDRAGVEVRR